MKDEERGRVGEPERVAKKSKKEQKRIWQRPKMSAQLNTISLDLLKVKFKMRYIFSQKKRENNLRLDCAAQAHIKIESNFLL